MAFRKAYGFVASACLALATASKPEGVLFLEDFQGPDPLSKWIKSSNEKYNDQPVSVSKLEIPGFPGEKTLLLEKGFKHYGVAMPFEEPIDNKDKELVIQYEVKLDELLQCGGAYVKLFTHDASLNLDEFNNDTPYTIMFGPDRCGATNKVHFILRHQNPVTGKWEEKHAKNPPAIKGDQKTHLYTLVIRPDNSFEIFIDKESAKKGSLLEDLEPPVNPAKLIDDPTDVKPSDWVDEAKIPDPAAKKPEDWDEEAPREIPDEEAVKPEGWIDDAPEYVADPEATEPEDWDVEEDGEWEAPMIPNPQCEDGPGCGEWVRPMIPNPKYKGKWYAPMIDNPAYKGEWKPRQIDNPAYFEDKQPHNVAKIGALAVEVWTITGGIRFDNFLVSYNEAAAFEYADKTWAEKNKAELVAEDQKAKDRKAEARKEKFAKGGWKGLAEAYFSDAKEFAYENPVASGITFGVLLLTIFASALRSRRAKASQADETVAKKEIKEEENDENEDSADKPEVNKKED